MYKAFDEDRVSNQNPVAAVLDRKERDAENKANFNAKEVVRAEALLNEVREAFFRRNVYLNYNQKDIVIKINRPMKVDLVSAEVARLEKKLTNNGVTIKVLKSGNRIYHLPRVDD